jgi:protease-4
MSDVAASGGYWVTTSADRVIADPGTITGSIGVFGILPTVDRTLDKAGVHTGGTTTTWLAGAADLRRPIDSRLASVIQSTISYIYSQFLGRVSQARQITPEQVAEIAQGRVWTGHQARERGLIDELGGLQAAVQAAATLAKLEPGYRTSYIEAEPKGWYRLLASLPSASLRSVLGNMVLPKGSLLAETAGPLQTDLAWLGYLPGTRGAYVHCLCAAPQ